MEFRNAASVANDQQMLCFTIVAPDGFYIFFVDQQWLLLLLHLGGGVFLRSVNSLIYALILKYADLLCVESFEIVPGKHQATVGQKKSDLKYLIF